MAVPDFPVTITDAAWGAFKYKFSAICSNLKAIAIVPSLCFITHETEKCHVDRGHAKLESFKVKAKILTKAMEDLKRIKVDKLTDWGSY